MRQGLRLPEVEEELLQPEVDEELDQPMMEEACEGLLQLRVVDELCEEMEVHVPQRAARPEPEVNYSGGPAQSEIGEMQHDTGRTSVHFHGGYATAATGCAGGHQERHLPIAGPEAGGANGPGQFSLSLAGGGSRFTWMFSSASVG